MNYHMCWTTPDNPEESEEFFETIEECQARKDEVMSLPWLTHDGLSFCVGDVDGNEIPLQ